MWLLMERSALEVLEYWDEVPLSHLFTRENRRDGFTLSSKDCFGSSEKS